MDFMHFFNLLLEYWKEFEIEYIQLNLGLNLKILYNYHDKEVLEKGKPIYGDYKLPQIV